MNAEFTSKTAACGIHYYPGRDVERELCYQKIKGAYAEEFFVGKFVMPEWCASYKESYDKKFRVVTIRN